MNGYAYVERNRSRHGTSSASGYLRGDWTDGNSVRPRFTAPGVWSQLNARAPRSSYSPSKTFTGYALTPASKTVKPVASTPRSTSVLNGEACRGSARDDRNGCQCFEVRLLWIVCALARADCLGREAESSVRVPRDTRGGRPDRKDRTWGGNSICAADCVAYAADRRSWINIITTVMSNMIALSATGIGPQIGAAILDTHMIILDTIFPGGRSLPNS